MSAGDDGEYGDYMRHRTNISSVLALFSGFSFTAITILITRLQNPSSIESQVVLFFLNGIFDLFIFLLGYNTIECIYLCRHVPIATRALRVFNSLVYLSFLLFQFAVVAMFLLWGLTYLAVAALGVSMLFFLASYLVIWKPFWKHRE